MESGFLFNSDDWWEPKKLEEIFKIINSSDYYDVVVHNEYKIDDKNNQKHILKYGPYEKTSMKLIIFGNEFRFLQQQLESLF